MNYKKYKKIAIKKSAKKGKENKWKKRLANEWEVTNQVTNQVKTKSPPTPMVALIGRVMNEKITRKLPIFSSQSPPKATVEKENKATDAQPPIGKPSTSMNFDWPVTIAMAPSMKDKEKDATVALLNLANIELPAETAETANKTPTMPAQPTESLINTAKEEPKEAEKGTKEADMYVPVIEAISDEEITPPGTPTLSTPDISPSLLSGGVPVSRMNAFIVYQPAIKTPMARNADDETASQEITSYQANQEVINISDDEANTTEEDVLVTTEGSQEDAAWKTIDEWGASQLEQSQK